MRLLILMGIAFLGYRAVKSWMLPNARSRDPVSGQKTDEIDDVMVKDPFCNTYFPKRNGVRLKHQGESLLFCSSACRDAFTDASRERSM
jgi:uncharacterized protein